MSKGKEDMKDDQLKIEMLNDKLVISIGIKTLQHSCEEGRSYGGGEVKITNEEQFLEGITNALRSEEEDGATLIHHAFEQAVNRMLEDGELGIDDLDVEY